MPDTSPAVVRSNGEKEMKIKDGTIVEMHYVMPTPAGRSSWVYPEVVVTKHGRYTVETFGRLLYGVMKDGEMYVFNTILEAAVFSEGSEA